MTGDCLATPLARNISHRQAAVRAVTVAAVGKLGLATQGGFFEDMVNYILLYVTIQYERVHAQASHMAQRVFDPSPAVRRRHVEVLGAWCLAMPDRCWFSSGDSH